MRIALLLCFMLLVGLCAIFYWVGCCDNAACDCTWSLRWKREQVDVRAADVAEDFDDIFKDKKTRKIRRLKTVDLTPKAEPSTKKKFLFQAEQQTPNRKSIDLMSKGGDSISFAGDRYAYDDVRRTSTADKLTGASTVMKSYYDGRTSELV